MSKLKQSQDNYNSVSEYLTDNDISTDYSASFKNINFIKSCSVNLHKKVFELDNYMKDIFSY